MAIGRTKTTDRADRATVEKVFDFRTKFIIYKLMGRDVCKEINGCISTGKEANVYHATNSDGQERAIKVFKTSVLDFKRGYCKNNPRKMMKTWAEKEMRNLKRLYEYLGDNYLNFPVIHHIQFPSGIHRSYCSNKGWCIVGAGKAGGELDLIPHPTTS
ncbi:uncharacterized protein LOC133710613 [Rosa rugosa]|uniref:uncharacterized protein LOC133710613 n=1 Tax=Rosa rugosa TaxID=74645 RepID=UPI002B40CC5C|nr:uncharacterized protein LOC133710613 [Rosa rugosa]XP_061992707.1 uncharacterized protein LOC133710613 [Rosa rugosa]XP_061992708.1 uncharacterized protein LOC133710613 [Rosa rugosa]XP_061992709.1 uncharacterized protein LOC133710613 [Rosa rugosa]XP_061992710.1 uncharacterized protein LOC133710613 [Rosa rugosa]